MVWEIFAIIILSFVISALPLFFSVTMLGARTNIFRVIGVNVVVGLVVAGVYLLLPFASLIAVIATIFLYREFFRIKWWKALLAWFLQSFIAFLLVLILVAVFGLSIVF